MKFLDTNVLAYAFYNNENTDRCQAAVMEGGLTDAFSLIEAFHVIEKETGSRELAQRAVRGLLKSDVEIIAVDVNTIFESVKKAGSLKLSIFDTVHYICAFTNNCESILSYDRDFDGLGIRREEPGNSGGK